MRYERVGYRDGPDLHKCPRASACAACAGKSAHPKRRWNDLPGGLVEIGANSLTPFQIKISMRGNVPESRMVPIRGKSPGTLPRNPQNISPWESPQGLGVPSVSMPGWGSP